MKPYSMRLQMQIAIQIKNRLIKHVNVNVKIIVHAIKIIVGTLTHAFVRMVTISKVLLMI